MHPIVDATKGLEKRLESGAGLSTSPGDRLRYDLVPRFLIARHSDKGMPAEYCKGKIISTSYNRGSTVVRRLIQWEK